MLRPNKIRSLSSNLLMNMPKWLPCVGFLLVALWPSFIRAEIYSWTDPRGVIHFTDNFLSVPEAVRNSSELVIREERPAKENFSQTATPNPVAEEETSSWPQVSEATRLPDANFTNAAPSIVYDNRQNFNIVVINSLTRLPHQRHCRTRDDCKPGFRLNFNDRRFIHPSVFNGGSRQFIRR